MSVKIRMEVVHILALTLLYTQYCIFHCMINCDLQILMSVSKEMEDVNIHVKTLLVAITVHVILGINHLENIAMVIIKNYGFDIFTFLDINECNQGNGGCEHTCTNTVGSYYCTCYTGYTLNKNGRTCTGIILVSLNC